MNKIRELRVKAGLSLRELAEKADVGAATLARLEAGGKAYAQTLYRLAKYFGVDYSELAEFEFVSPKSGHPTRLNKRVA